MLNVNYIIVLLIVPYGIETHATGRKEVPHRLLIVPYGIETSHGGERYVRSRPFNRTLWN